MLQYVYRGFLQTCDTPAVKKLLSRNWMSALKPVIWSAFAGFNVSPADICSYRQFQRDGIVEIFATAICGGIPFTNVYFILLSVYLWQSKKIQFTWISETLSRLTCILITLHVINWFPCTRKYPVNIFVLKGRKTQGNRQYFSIFRFLRNTLCRTDRISHLLHRWQYHFLSSDYKYHFWMIVNSNIYINWYGHLFATRQSSERADCRND